MPGKFRSPADEYVYEVTLDQSAVECEAGDANGCGEHVAMTVELAPEEVDNNELPGYVAIVRTDEQGFVDVDWFVTRWEALQDWRETIQPVHDSHVCGLDDAAEDNA